MLILYPDSLPRPQETALAHLKGMREVLKKDPAISHHPANKITPESGRLRLSILRLGIL